MAPNEKSPSRIREQVTSATPRASSILVDAAILNCYASFGLEIDFMILLEEAKATLDDLYREPGKAELIDGRIVRFMPTGDDPGCFALNIATLLREL